MKGECYLFVAKEDSFLLALKKVIITVFRIEAG